MRIPGALQRLLASGLLSDSRQQKVREWFEHPDPLALSERLDEALQTLWSSTPLLPARKMEGWIKKVLKEDPFPIDFLSTFLKRDSSVSSSFPPLGKSRKRFQAMLRSA